MLASSVSARINLTCELISLIFSNVLVLDSNVKLAYARDKWDFEATQDGIARLEAVVYRTLKSSSTQLIYVMQFDEYYTPCPASPPETTTPLLVSLVLFGKMTTIILLDRFIFESECAVRPSKPHEELDQYLDTPLEVSRTSPGGEA
jgi:hypothetical protein